MEIKHSFVSEESLVTSSGGDEHMTIRAVVLFFPCNFFSL